MTWAERIKEARHEVRKRLESAHVVAGIKAILPAVERVRMPAGVASEARNPLDALDAYLSLQGTDEARRGVLRAKAEAMLA